MRRSARRLRLTRPMDVRDRTPFALADAVSTAEPATKPDLVRISREIERELLADPPPAVAACLQDSRFLSGRTREVYARLAQAGAAVRLHGRGMQTWIDPGVSGVPLDDDSPLVDEWVIVVPGRVLFAAADLRAEDCPDDERTFTFCLTRDEAASRTAGALLGV